MPFPDECEILLAGMSVFVLNQLPRAFAALVRGAVEMREAVEQLVRVPGDRPEADVFEIG